MKNRIQCLKCGVVLESKHRHDFQECHCENQSFVDGGNDYCRIGGKNLKLVKVLGDNEKPKKFKIKKS